MEDVLICDFIRTPIGRYAGALSAVRADDLAALPIKYLKDKHQNLPWNTVDEVFLGCANQAGEDNRNVAAFFRYVPADTSGELGSLLALMALCMGWMLYERMQRPRPAHWHWRPGWRDLRPR